MMHLITFFTTDEDLESNFLWHGGTFFSLFDDVAGGKIKVIDQFGFYPVPGEEEDTSFYGNLKKKADVKIDSQGNHGWLIREKCRDLDRGYGLHGVTYEVDEQTFTALHDEYMQELIDQQTAVDEIAKTNGFEKKQGKIRYYDHEHLGKTIFGVELAKSRAQGRPARLKTFDLDLSWGLTGPSLAKSHTCKTHAIDHLKKFIGEKKTARLTAGGHDAVPRFSGQMEAICLHSEGPILPHTKSNGKIVYYRDVKDPNVSIYWSIPPHEFVTDSDETKKQLLLDVKYDVQIKPMVKILQKLQQFLLDQQPLEVPFEVKNRLVQLFQSHYEFFSVVPARKEIDYPKPCSSLKGQLINTLFAPPRNEHEKELQANIKKSKLFLEMIYTTIVDGQSVDASDSSSIDSEDKPEAYTDSDLLNMVFNLSPGQKMQICGILGRSYLEPDVEYRVACNQ